VISRCLDAVNKQFTSLYVYYFGVSVISVIVLITIISSV
jgi:hypothetical protein